MENNTGKFAYIYGKMYVKIESVENVLYTMNEARHLVCPFMLHINSKNG
jgi:hypothetical protein